MMQSDSAFYKFYFIFCFIIRGKHFMKLTETSIIDKKQYSQKIVKKKKKKKKKKDPAYAPI